MVLRQIWNDYVSKIWNSMWTQRGCTLHVNFPTGNLPNSPVADRQQFGQPRAFSFAERFYTCPVCIGTRAGASFWRSSRLLSPLETLFAKLLFGFCNFALENLFSPCWGSWWDFERWNLEMPRKATSSGSASCTALAQAHPLEKDKFATIVTLSLQDPSSISSWLAPLFS